MEEHYVNFITINIKKRSCNADAVELNGDFDFAVSGGGVVPA